MRNVFLATIFVLYGCSSFVHAADLYVPSQYSTIQAAIDASSDGDIILVSSGTYIDSSRFTFKDGITIQGAGIDSTIISTIGFEGMYIMDVSKVTISDLTIRDSGKYRHTDGGGIRIYNSNTITIKNCRITNNEAVNGAGIYIEDASDIVMKNCLIDSNRAFNIGGGIVITHGDLSLENVTIADNTANWDNSGGISAYHGIINLKNSIVWGNGNNIYYGSNGEVLANFCDIGETVSGSDNINQNPEFVSGPNGDNYLSQTAAGQLSNSPCVDAGSDLASEIDITGTTRTDDFDDLGIVDIGFHYGAQLLSELSIAVDIKPGSCPNPIRVNFKGNGVIPVAILGTESFDVLDIDVATIGLEGVSPVRSSFGDVSAPFDGEECECNLEGPDGFLDLTVKFKRKDVLAALEESLGDLSEIEHRTDIPLTLTVMLMGEEETLEGTDCIRILNRMKKARK